MTNHKFIIQAMGMHSAKYGGFERYIVLLSKELYKKGIRTIVIYNSRPKSEKFITDLNQSGGILVISHAMKPFGYFRTIRQLFKEYKPFALHAHFQFYYSVVYARLCKCKQVYYSLHGMAFDHDGVFYTSSKDIPIKPRILRYVVNKLASNIFAVSEEVKKQQVKLFPIVKKKILVHYLGSMPNHNLNSNRKRYTLPENTILIGTISFNDRVKGFDILMEASKILLKKYKFQEFLICQIGIDPKDDNNTHLMKLCNEMGLSKHIKWLGIRNDVSSILPSLDIYCQPSRSEALSLSIVEAGMAGLPIIGSKVGGIPEVVKDEFNGLLFKTEDANELAQKLYSLIIDQNAREKMGQNSRRYMLDKFNIQKQIKVIRDFYLDTFSIKH